MMPTLNHSKYNRIKLLIPHNKPNVQPVIGAGLGRAAMGLSVGQGDIEKNALMVKIEVLANALLTLSIFGAIIGFLEMVNAGFLYI